MVSWNNILILAGLLLLSSCSGPASETDDNSSQMAAEESDLYAAAQREEQQGRPKEAIEIYRRILHDYPDSPENYKAEFLIGFVYAEELNNTDSARVVFQRVIDTYPGTEFVDDAEAMLKFLDGQLPDFEETTSP